jgi:hypothetical protein
MVGLEHTLFKISNDVGMVELCAVVYQPANVECPIAFSFDVRLATMDGTAVNPMDYLQLNSTLSFATCQKRRCMNVLIVNDMVDEPEEFFNYTLERTPGLDTRILLAPIDGQISISDDHGVSQVCYSEPGCAGYVVETPGPTVRDCCVGTNDGQSYADSGGTCIKNQCVGESVYI